MYTHFFGLNEKPFAITPDPRYLFMSERHGEGLAHLVYGVTESGGFIQLTGEVGTGKTTLVRTLLGQLPEEVDIALILNPQVTVIEFLQAICRELNVPLPEGARSGMDGGSMALVDALNRFLLDAHAQGRRIILLVDEAQNLSELVLEQLRLLTNLETARQKLLQIILIGQPELRDVLAQNNLRQLAQRVTGRYHLEPLSREEAAEYIEHRMKVAGALTEVFTDEAKREVHSLSAGVPRLMNVICDRALLGAYGREQRSVDKALVRAAAKEVSGTRDKPASGRPLWPWAVGIAAAAAIAGAGLAITLLPADVDSSSNGDSRVADSRSAAPASSATPPAEVAAAADPETTTPEAENASAEPPAAIEPAAGEPASAQPALAERLASGEMRTSADAAMSDLLSLWGLSFDGGAGGGCRQAEAAGLSCLWQRGSWNLLERLNRPAILMLTDANGAAHQAVLRAIAGDRAELGVGEDKVTVSVNDIEDSWFGRYMLVWRPPVATSGSIRPGNRGPAVAWLRRSLDQLDGKEATAGTNDFFDPVLERRVREFQRQHRLQVDGMAGEQTLIVINSALSAESVPQLTEDTS